MRGHIQEYRSGRFRVIWYFNGEWFSTTQYLDKIPLYHRKQADRLLEHINSLIDSHKFDPEGWRKDSQYLFEKAVEVWINLSNCSYETIQSRERITKNFLIPFFKGRNIREIKRIDIDAFHNELKKQGRSAKYIYKNQFLNFPCSPKLHSKRNLSDGLRVKNRMQYFNLFPMQINRFLTL